MTKDELKIDLLDLKLRVMRLIAQVDDAPIIERTVKTAEQVKAAARVRTLLSSCVKESEQ